MIPSDDERREISKKNLEHQLDQIRLANEYGVTIAASLADYFTRERRAAARAAKVMLRYRERMGLPPDPVAQELVDMYGPGEAAIPTGREI